MGRFSVLVFRPKQVSYERSRGIDRWVLREISARAFVRCPKIPEMSQTSKFWGNNKISNFRQNCYKKALTSIPFGEPIVLRLNGRLLCLC